MKLPQLAAVFLTLGVGIAGVMAVEASAERARVVPPPAPTASLLAAATTTEIRRWLVSLTWVFSCVGGVDLMVQCCGCPAVSAISTSTPRAFAAA